MQHHINNDILEFKWHNNAGEVAIATYGATTGALASLAAPGVIVTLQQVAA